MAGTLGFFIAMALGGGHCLRGFVSINRLHVRDAATFLLVVTILAVAELLGFMALSWVGWSV